MPLVPKDNPAKRFKLLEEAAVRNGASCVNRANEYPVVSKKLVKGMLLFNRETRVMVRWNGREWKKVPIRFWK